MAGLDKPIYLDRYLFLDASAIVSEKEIVIPTSIQCKANREL